MSEEGPLFVKIGFVVEESSLETAVEKAKREFTDSIAKTVRDTEELTTQLKLPTSDEQREFIDNVSSARDILESIKSTYKIGSAITDEIKESLSQPDFGVFKSSFGQNIAFDMNNNLMREYFREYATKWISDSQRFARGKEVPFETYMQDFDMWGKEYFHGSSMIAQDQTSAIKFLKETIGLDVDSDEIRNLGLFGMMGGIDDRGEFFIDMMFDKVSQKEEGRVLELIEQVNQRLGESMRESVEGPLYQFLEDGIINAMTAAGRELEPEEAAAARDMLYRTRRARVGAAVIGYDPMQRGLEAPDSIVQLRARSEVLNAVEERARSLGRPAGELDMPFDVESDEEAKAVFGMMYWMDEAKSVKRELNYALRSGAISFGGYDKPMKTISWEKGDIVDRGSRTPEDITQEIEEFGDIFTRLQSGDLSPEEEFFANKMFQQQQYVSLEQRLGLVRHLMSSFERGIPLQEGPFDQTSFSRLGAPMSLGEGQTRIPLSEIKQVFAQREDDITDREFSDAVRRALAVSRMRGIGAGRSVLERSGGGDGEPMPIGLLFGMDIPSSSGMPLQQRLEEARRVEYEGEGGKFNVFIIEELQKISEDVKVIRESTEENTFQSNLAGGRQRGESSIGGGAGSVQKTSHPDTTSTKLERFIGKETGSAEE